MKKRKAFLIVGARPNIVKVAALYSEFKKRNYFQPILVHTGQHYAKNLSDVFFKEFGLPKPHFHLKVGSLPYEKQIHEIRKKIRVLFQKQKPDLCVVVGDVTSTLACALAAKEENIFLAHIEAGLRSFDKTMPEEINRMLTDIISDALFVTEPSGLKNLKDENIPSHKVHFVGNVMIDTLKKYLSEAQGSGVFPDEFGVVTLHRPSNVDDPKVLRQRLKMIQRVSQKTPILFPLHPRTKKNIQKYGLTQELRAQRNIKVMPAQSYLSFMQMVQRARFVLTDSGGVQEETTFLGVPCLTLRQNTERPITIEKGTNVLCGVSSQKVLAEVDRLLKRKKHQRKKIPKWDGNASERIHRVLQESFSK